MQQEKDLITLKNISVRFWQNNVGVHSIKDLLTHRKNPFTNKTILNNISLTVNKGESIGLLGRNGSGKSTLLRTIAGIIKPYEGTVDVNGTFAPMLAIGAGLELELTGYENINLLLSLYGNGRVSKDLVQTVKEFSELDEEALRMPVKRYSSGMVSRLGFSISQAHEADILIIDEVLAVGDQGFQAKCMDRIYKIKAEGKTILFVSHFPDDVKRVCDKAILLEDGKIKYSGTADEICEKYKALFIQS